MKPARNVIFAQSRGPCRHHHHRHHVRSRSATDPQTRPRKRALDDVVPPRPAKKRSRSLDARSTSSLTGQQQQQNRFNVDGKHGAAVADLFSDAFDDLVASGQQISVATFFDAIVKRSVGLWRDDYRGMHDDLKFVAELSRRLWDDLDKSIDNLYWIQTAHLFRSANVFDKEAFREKFAAENHARGLPQDTTTLEAGKVGKANNLQAARQPTTDPARASKKTTPVLSNTPRRLVCDDDGLRQRHGENGQQQQDAMYQQGRETGPVGAESMGNVAAGAHSNEAVADQLRCEFVNMLQNVIKTQLQASGPSAEVKSAITKDGVSLKYGNADVPDKRLAETAVPSSPPASKAATKQASMNEAKNTIKSYLYKAFTGAFLGKKASETGQQRSLSISSKDVKAAAAGKKTVVIEEKYSKGRRVQQERIVESVDDSADVVASRTDPHDTDADDQTSADAPPIVDQRAPSRNESGNVGIPGAEIPVLESGVADEEIRPGRNTSAAGESKKKSLQRVDSGCATNHTSMVQSSSLIPEPTAYSSFFSDISGCPSETKARKSGVAGKSPSKPSTQAHTQHHHSHHQHTHYTQPAAAHSNYQSDSEDSCTPKSAQIIDETLRLCEPCRRFFGTNLRRLASKSGAAAASDLRKKMDDDFRAAWLFANRKATKKEKKARRLMEEELKLLNDVLATDPPLGNSIHDTAPLMAFVLYELDPAWTDAERGKVMDALRRFKEETELSFFPRSHHPECSQLPYLMIKKGDLCSSMVGYKREAAAAGTPTVVMSPSCLKPETATHELVHAVAFYHEDAGDDSDRDIIQVGYPEEDCGRTV